MGRDLEPQVVGILGDEEGNLALVVVVLERSQFPIVALHVVHDLGLLRVDGQSTFPQFRIIRLSFLEPFYELCSRRELSDHVIREEQHDVHMNVLPSDSLFLIEPFVHDLSAVHDPFKRLLIFEPGPFEVDLEIVRRDRGSLHGAISLCDEIVAYHQRHMLAHGHHRADSLLS